MKVKVFSTPTCPYCIQLKNYLKENNIEFEDINVAENESAREEMIKKSTQMGVPVFMLTNENGKEDVVVGFNKDKISELLKL